MSPTGTCEFLDLVEARLHVLLAPDDQAPHERNVLAAAAHHLCLGNGGKRIRPRVVALLGRAAGASGGALEEVAAAAELIHGASLLHDDVVDQARQRRGRPTANARFGNQVAVLAGDWLLSRAFGLLRGHPPQVTFEAIEVVAEMARAAVAELEARGEGQLPLERWRQIAEGKTGALFGWCGRAAAQVAGDEALAGQFDRFGRRLGVAFQMADDLKDLWGGEVGKDRFADLRNRNPSVPIMLAASRGGAFATRLAQCWSGSAGVLPESEVDELGRLLLETDAVQEASAMLGQQTAAALEEFGEQRDRPWFDELRALVDGIAQGPARS